MRPFAPLNAAGPLMLRTLKAQRLETRGTFQKGRYGVQRHRRCVATLLRTREVQIPRLRSE